MRRNNELRFSRRRIDEMKKQPTRRQSPTKGKYHRTQSSRQASMQTQSHTHTYANPPLTPPLLTENSMRISC